MYARFAALALLFVASLLPALAAQRYVPQRGVDAVFVASASAAYLIYSLSASLLLASLSRSFLAGISSLISLSILAPSSLIPGIFLLAVGLLALVYLRERLGEPLLDLLRGAEGYSPVALSLAALSLYVVNDLLVSELSCWQRIAFYVASLIAAATASIAAEEPYESLPAGALAGLGPFGLAIISLYASHKPVSVRRCEGIEVGELAGIGGRFSATRSLIRLKDGQGGQETLACSREGRAVLALREPWILWIYGERAEEIAGYLVSRLGGFYIVKMSSIDAGIADSLRLGESVWIDLSSVGVSMDSIRLVNEIAREKRRVIVTASDLPLEGSVIAPKGPAQSSGFIVAGLKDPLQAERVARLVSEAGREELKSIVSRGELFVAYPSCAGTPLLFRKE